MGNIDDTDIVFMFMMTLQCRTTTILEITWRPPVFPWGVLEPVLIFLSFQMCNKPLGLSL